MEVTDSALDVKLYKFCFMLLFVILLLLLLLLYCVIVA